MIITQDYLIHKLKELKLQFLSPITAVTQKPKAKFLQQALPAVLLSGTLVVTIFARWINDRCSDPFYSLKRLLNHILRNSGWYKIAQAYRTSMNRFLSPDTPIIIDMTDLAKPRARKMKYLAMVRDGSEDKIVPGYWCLEVYAYLKKKRVIPLALDVFSIDDPTVASENLQIEKTIQAVDKDIKHKGIWIADRGFDRLEVLKTLFSLNARFIIRQRGDRHVIVGDRVAISVYDLAERLYQQQVNQGNLHPIVFCPVRLPRRQEPLFVIAHFRENYDRPLLLLTNMKVFHPYQADQVVADYRKRWSCEEAIEFLKGRVGFENFRIRRYEAIQHLSIIAMLAMGFLSWILLRNQIVTGLLLNQTSKFRKKVRFQYYRLLDGLQQLAKIELTKQIHLIVEPP